MPNDPRAVASRHARRLAFSLALALVVTLVGGTPVAQAQNTTPGLRVLSAGSLRAARTEVARAFEAQHQGANVALVFGASGLLKDRLMAGEAADVFASANMEHPTSLATAGRASPTRPFASNRLCALAGPEFAATPDTLVARLLDPRVRVGTSTPKADPAGDYTWQFFERIEAQGHAGAFKLLADKALQLTGGPQSPPPPANRNVYGALMASGQADVFITYCTNAVVAQAEETTLRRIEIPAAINVSAAYGVTVMTGAGADAQPFVDFLLGPKGQALLARHGFSPP